MHNISKLNRYLVLTCVALAALALAGVAGATGFDVTALTTQAQSTWQAAILVILGTLGVFLGARIAIKWAVRLLGR